MIPTNPYVLGLIIAIALGYAAVDAVKQPVKHAAHTVCHVVTLGHKCKSQE